MALADEPVIPQGPLADAPVVGSAPLGDLDQYGTRSSGPFYRGLRGGFSSLGQGAHNLLGNFGETLGLTDFAATRFADADQYAKNADANSPVTRDYRDIKDFDSLVDYVAGQAGQATATSIPAAAGAALAVVSPRLAAGMASGLRGAFRTPGGLLGRTAAGVSGAVSGAAKVTPQTDALTRTVLGLGAGSFVPNAGEQAGNIRDLPGTPLEKTLNAVGVGGVNAALEVVAPGSVAKRVLGRGAGSTLLKGVAKTAGLEGLTEGAQDVVGQAGERVLDPNKTLDTASVINSAAGGAIGGTLLGGGGHVASMAPGLAAKVADKARELAPKSRQEQLDEALGTSPRPVDAEDLSSVVENKDLKDPEDILKAIDGLEGDETSFLTKMGQKIGGTWANVETWANDPEKRAELKQKAAEWLDQHEVTPRVKAALEHGRRAFDEAAKAAKESYEANRTKPSLGRTALDAQILEAVNERLPERIKRNTTPDERAEIASWFKHAAMYAGARQEEVGPQPAARQIGPGNSEPGLPNINSQGVAEETPRVDVPFGKREQDRPTRAVPLPSALLHFGGKDTVATIQHVQEILKANLGEGSVRGRPQEAVREAVKRVTDQRDPLEKIIHENMKQEFYENPAQRRQVTEGFMRMLEADVTPFENQNMAAPQEGVDNQRLSPAGRRLMEAAGMIFQDRPKAMRQIEAQLQQKANLHEPTGTVALPGGREFHLTDEEIQDFKGLQEESDTDTQDAGADFGGRRAAEDHFENDARLRAYDSIPEARQAYRDLTDRHTGYDKRYVQINSEQEMEYDAESGQMQPTGRIILSAKDRQASTGLTGQPAVEKNGKWVGSGEWGNITDKSPSHQAGFRHGTITATLTDGKVVRVSLKALTKEAVKQTDMAGVGKKYPHDVIMHGLTMLAADPRVAKLEEKKGSGALGENGQWNFPPSTVMGTVNGQEYTWRQLTKMAKMSPAELKMRHLTERPVEAAKEADSISDIEDTIVPWVQDRVKKLGDILAVDEANLAKAKKSTDAGRIEKAQKFRDISKSRLDRMLGAQEQVLAEIDRRETEGDRPVDIEPGSFDVDAMIREQQSQPTTRSREEAAGRTGARLVQEETGETLQGAPRRDGRQGYAPHEVGQRPEDRANPGWKTTQLAEGAERVPVSKEATGKEPKAQPLKSTTVVEDGRPVTKKIAVDEKAIAQEEAQPDKSPEAPPPAEGGKYKRGDTYVHVNRDGTETPVRVSAVLDFGGTQFVAHKAFNGKSGFFVREVQTGMHVGGSEKTLKGAVAKAKETLERMGEDKVKTTVAQRLAELAVRKSDMRVNALEPVSEETKAKVYEYVASVLGKDRTKALFADLAHAGDFAFDKESGVELLRIANLAMDPMGAARHEAAHALVRRLLASDKAAAQTLMAAAGSPTIIAKLRENLKGHPDALAQLKDPEERVAYMYQFWASGDLTVGPNTKTWMEKIKSFFRTVASVWTGTFYESESAHEAAQIFDLFDRGHLANRDTVAEVLRDKVVKSAVARADKLLGPASKVAKALIYTSVSSVKSMNVPAFNGIMDKMWHDQTTESKLGPGFNQAKHPARNQFLTQLESTIGDTTAETRREAIEALQSNTLPKSDEARRVVAGVRKLLSDVFTYMKGKDVKAVVWNDKTSRYEEHDVSFVQDYFPRYYDKDAIRADRKKFTAMLERNGLSRTEANAVADNIVRSQAAQPGENDYETGLTYYAPNTQARRLNVPASELAPFLRKDLGDSLRSYIGYAVRRAEYASRFGNQGQLIKQAEEQAIRNEGATPEQVRTFNRAVQALEGSLGHDLNPDLKTAMSAVQTYQHLRLLPLAIFSSLTVDPLGIMVRGGTAAESFGAFVRVVRNLVSESKDEAYDMAVAVGSISSAIDTHMIEEAYGTQDFNSFLGKVNQALFRWNGMESLNRSMRTAATAAAHNFIVRHLTKPTEHSARYLAELGLTKDTKVTDGKLDLADQKVRDAINMWVDGAVLRPNAAIRPTWTSDPHWMLVSSLKQYMYAFQDTIIKRVAHEMNNGNYTAAYALLTYVPAIIAADVLRAVLTPGGADDDAWKRASLGQVLGRGIQRAAITGPMGQFAMDTYGDLKNYNVPFASLGGPTFEQLANFGKAAAGAPGSSVAHEAARAIPGYILVK